MKRKTWLEKLLYVLGALSCFAYVVIRIITWNKLEQGILVKGQGIITIVGLIIFGLVLMSQAFPEDTKE